MARLQWPLKYQKINTGDELLLISLMSIMGARLFENHQKINSRCFYQINRHADAHLR